MRRSEGDQDTDGWSTVKPRKSFGTEGAERFNGRMGGDRHREDRRFKDRDDRDPRDRPARGFENFTRDKDADLEAEGTPRRNGVGRGRNEQSWFKDNSDSPVTTRERNNHGDRHADKSRGWREKDRDDKDTGRGFDRTSDRIGDKADKGQDRRWDRDRDQRQEREPEWMDEPADERKQAHTQEDFQKWKERMKAGSGATPMDEAAPKTETNEGGAGFFGFDTPKVETPLVIDAGPDKFFGNWAKSEGPSDLAVASKKEGIPKASTVGKSSRFMSLWSAPEEAQRRTTEPPPSAPVDDKAAEAAAFKSIMEKLHQSKSSSGTTPPVLAALQPQPPPHLQDKPSSAPPQQQTPEPFHHFQPERQVEPRPPTQTSQHSLQDLMTQRQNALSQPSVRPDVMLQELVGQRQNALSQASSRPEQIQNQKSNKDFLMGLMRAAPDPLRSEQLAMRGPPPNQQPPTERQMQQMMEREQQEMQIQRERRDSQRRRQQDGPPNFYDDPSIANFRGPQPQPENNRGQPPMTILQRPPPGLDHQMPPGPPGWAQGNAQLPPPQQRHIPPPPGLVGGPTRGMPMPQMFPPGFPMNAFPPPEGMAGPPRNMPPPPPGFFPPGFMPPPMNGFPGPGPEGLPFGAFDGRGGPPPGGFRRQ
jgi:hypothetical protein